MKAADILKAAAVDALCLYSDLDVGDMSLSDFSPSEWARDLAEQFSYRIRNDILDQVEELEAAERADNVAEVADWFRVAAVQFALWARDMERGIR